MATTENKNKTSKAQRLGGERINEDWQYLNETKKIHNPTIDQKFNLEYKHKGLNSVSISKPKLIKKELVDKKSNTFRYTFNSRIQAVQNIVEEEEDIAPLVKKEGIIKKVFKKAQRTKIQLKAALINTSLVRAFLPLYLFQMYLAFISAIGLGILYTGNATVEYVSENGGVIGSMVGSAIEATISSIEGISSFLLGVAPSDVGAAVFLVPFMIIIAFNLIFILVVSFRHMIAGNHPFFGKEGGGTKVICFLIYCVCLFPIFNIFPFFLVWIFAIQKYPR